MSSDDGASTRIRKREGGPRYAHEGIARRNPGRWIRIVAALPTIVAVAVLGALVAGRTVDVVPQYPLHLDSLISISESPASLPDPDPFLVDPTPILVVAGVVRDASLIVAGLATGVGGCLLCVAAIRVREWR